MDLRRAWLHGFCSEARSGEARAASQRSSALTEEVFIVLQLDLKPSGQLAVDIRFFDQDPQHSVKVATMPKTSSQVAKAPPVNAMSNVSEHIAPSLDIKGWFNGLSYHFTLFSHLNS